MDRAQKGDQSASVHDVAAAIFEHLGAVDPLKLQKLLYYAQGWYAAWYGEPLFRERVEAWREGPTVRVIWDTYKDYGAQPIPAPQGGRPKRLNRQQREALEAILGAYGELDSGTLARRTHKERPWMEGWAKRRREREGSEEILLPELIRFFQGEARFPHEREGAPQLDEETVRAIFRGDRKALRQALQRAAEPRTEP